jgi:hypothetical protein
MIILDSNLWVFGTVGASARAERLLGEIEAGETTAAINAYILQEVLTAFDRTPGLSPAERDELKTLFCTRLTRMEGLVEAPSSRDASDALLAQRRAATHTALLARILDMQAKDVPILVLAFEHIERRPTILTNDASFASLNPSEHRIPDLDIEHVPVEH